MKHVKKTSRNLLSCRAWSATHPMHSYSGYKLSGLTGCTCTHALQGAARFPNKTSAGKAYDPIQVIIFAVKCGLPSYRLFEQNERKWYVVVIGEKPLPQFHQRIETILLTQTRGDRVTLDSETLAVLFARRTLQTQLGHGWSAITMCQIRSSKGSLA